MNALQKGSPDNLGNPNGGLANGGLARKAPIVGNGPNTVSECLEKGWNRQGVRLQYLAAATTLEACLEHPFTQPIANKLLHLKQQK